MFFNTLSPSHFVDNLKCSICKNYLSYFPIHITKSKQNVCGRCLLPKDNIHMRNDIYEIIAKEIEFPCRYSNEGCFKNVLPKDVPNHERVCPYRIVKCPTVRFTNCTENLPYPDLVQHCQENHSEIILKNGEFEVDLSQSSESTHLLLHNGAFFQFERKFDLKSNKLQYSFACVESAHNLTSFYYEIVLQNESRSFSVKGCVGDCIHERDTNKINLDLFASNSCYEDTINGKIVLGKKDMNTVQHMSITERMLKLLKCSDCKEYIQPENTMYWLNDKTTRCTKCARNVRNLSAITNSCAIWGLVSDHIFYPCQYKESGCSFSAPPSTIKEHEVSCRHRIYGCPLCFDDDDDIEGDCSWSGVAIDAIAHITEKHSDRIVDTLEISENVEDIFVKLYFLKFSSNLFRLVFEKNDDGYYWAVQMIGVSQGPFMFQVTILDNKRYKMLLARQECVSLSRKQDVLDDSQKYCFFTPEQMEPLINCDTISFVINIFK